MQTVTLHSADFKTIHNTLCELRGLAQRMEQSMVKIEEVQQIIESFEQGLADAYSQDDEQFDAKMVYFREFQRSHGLATIWSMYELPEGCFELPHPYPSAAVIQYQRVSVPVLGPTWGDVYQAANTAICESGDLHHCFIEAFELLNGDQVHLVTGS